MGIKSKCDQHNQTPDNVIRQLKGKEDTRLGWARFVTKTGALMKDGYEYEIATDITYNESIKIGKNHDFFIFIVHPPEPGSENRNRNLKFS